MQTNRGSQRHAVNVTCELNAASTCWFVFC